MKLAFCLFKYFPWGGLQRDFLRIAQLGLEQGHDVDVYTIEWEGPVPEGFTVHVNRVWHPTNHGRYLAFVRTIRPQLEARGYDVVIGFNKMPGLDVYYAADPCYEARVRRLRGRWYRYGSRYRHFSEFEHAVFGAQTDTQILLLSEAEKENFQRFYSTPEERFHLLPPGIARDRIAPPDADRIRAGFRESFGIGVAEYLVLLIGSGFRTKGLDRALTALAALPVDLRARTRLFAIGQDNPRPFQKLARRLGIARQLRIFPGRDDIPAFLLGADLLLHPAYSENTGTVLLEAMAAGLPVLATDVCGYAFHVQRGAGGVILPGPFHQEELNTRLADMLVSPQREAWRRNGLDYARSTDLYSLPEAALEVILATAGRESAP